MTSSVTADAGPPPRSAATGADRTAAFARQLVALELDVDDENRLADLLLDHVAVVIGGSDLPWVRAVHGWARRFHGTGQSLVAGTALLVAPEIAALANGVAAHGFELDDTHDTSLSHPGAVVFPTMLATGAERGVTGAAALAAAAAGYETIARLGEALDAPALISMGFHPTAVLGAFSAATTAARIFGLDADGLARAWGHALSLAGGSMQFSQEPAGADVKRLHAGYAARNGVLAAEMASAGVSAPMRSLEGRYGLLAMFGKDPRAERLTVAPRGRLAIHEVSLKPYACNRLLHSMIDGLRDLTDFDLDVGQVERIVVLGPRKLVDQHMVRRPRSTMAAQYSLPFTLGTAFVFGPEDLSAFGVRNLDDPRILAWADKVLVQEDPELEALYPAHFGTAVHITLADGRTLQTQVLDSVGTPRRPMTRRAILDKAGTLLCDLPADAVGQIAKTVSALRSAPSTAAVQQLLAPGAMHGAAL